MSESNQDIEHRIRSSAQEIGFDVIGFAKADLPPVIRERLMTFLELGRHGDMGWMETRAEQRAHPAVLWPEVKSVIMLGLNYGPDTNPLDALAEKTNGVISVYARNRDYHDIVKKKLKRLARQIVEETQTDLKVFVDTAPVMEKPLSARAGLGWQGKHTNLVSREFGSWLFLGAIYTTLELTPDGAEQDHCGSCQNCLEACPTDAFPAPYQLDAKKCISYLTIEHDGPIPLALRKPIGNRIYGCDDCLAVCPWNKFASLSRETKLQAREELKSPSLTELVQLDDTAFRTLFSGSPVKRTGRNRFIRNVLIAIGNSGDATLVEHAELLLTDDSPLVRGAAVWALYELAPKNLRSFLSLIDKEQDATVLAEWRTAG